MRALLILLLLFVQPIYAKTLVISDVDDTIRLTHRTADLWEQLENVSDSTLAFKGLPEIYRSLEKNGATIAYVSATVAPISEFAEALLETNAFPQSENFYYKGWFDDTKTFKVDVIEDLIRYHQADKIILIGDNGETDMDAYQVIASRYPDVSVYIHKLYSGAAHSIPLDQKIFYTGADLAVALYQEKSLTEIQVEEATSLVAQSTLSGDMKEQNLVLPDWAIPVYEDVHGLYQSSPLPENIQKDLDLIENYLLIFYDLKPAWAAP